MLYPDTEVYNLLDSPPEDAKFIFEQSIKQITEQNFELKQNYLNINLTEFYCFNIALYKKKLVAFSGMQKRPEQPQYARINNRLYIAPEFRAESLSYSESRRSDLPAHLRNPSFYLLLPEQIKMAIELKLNGVFISREKPNQIRMIEQIVNEYNKLNLTTEKFVILDDVYNVVGRGFSGKGCWQKIIFMPLSNEASLKAFSDLFEKISIEDWKLRFG